MHWVAGETLTDESETLCGQRVATVGRERIARREVDIECTSCHCAFRRDKGHGGIRWPDEFSSAYTARWVVAEPEPYGPFGYSKSR